MCVPVWVGVFSCVCAGYLQFLAVFRALQPLGLLSTLELSKALEV